MDYRSKLRRELLTLLKEDEEFRLSVQGLIGLKEVLERMEKIERRMEKIEERMEKIEEIIEEHSKAIKEHSKVIEEHSKVIEEHSKAIRELSVVVSEVRVAVGSLGRRWGRDLEKTVLSIYRHALEERGVKPGKVEKFTYVDVEGKYRERGFRLEIDVYIHDEVTYFLEVKSHVEVDDVEWFKEKCEIAGKILGRKPSKLFVVAVNIDKEALERSLELGMEAIYGSVIQ